MCEGYLPFLLGDATVDSNAGEVALRQQSIQLGCSLGALDKNDDLVELQLIEEVVQLPVLLPLLKLYVVLLETVEGELGLVVHVNLEGRLHKLFADGSNFLGESGGKHHDLLLLRSSTEDLLHVATHICLQTFGG